ncbi:MAG: phosphatidylglycerol---prolipoprotein diacylglyceryl transferase [Chloroflexota bacterium]|jgi:phosphatidylglycerol:prolipoprotein diacylglycerol transferase|nr:phosphatidylglycerol---prolipoprotein diacylglyceryl transferase [Chloroflexota bacterium]
MLGVITIPIDPVLQVGPFPIHWYGVGYAVAFLVGIRLVTPYLLKRGVAEKDASSLIWWSIAIGLLGARLYFVVQQPNLGDYLRNPIRIIAAWEGGMAFFGTIIALFFTLLAFAYIKKLSFWLLIDAGVLFATLPQAIGRVGNIINGDILGPPSDLPWAVAYTSPHTFAPAIGVGYQPAGAYELLVSLGLFFLISWVLRQGWQDGTAALVYGVAYPLSQLALFFVRATEPPVLLGLKQAQLTSLVFIFLVVPTVYLVRRRWPGIFARTDTATAGDQPGPGAAREPGSDDREPEPAAPSRSRSRRPLAKEEA